MSLKHAVDYPFISRQVGAEGSAIKGAVTLEDAKQDASERNAKAADLGIKARYEGVKTPVAETPAD